MKTSLSQFSKLEVASALKLDQSILLATGEGLYRYADGAAQAEPVPAWRGVEVKALGPAADGFVMVAGGDDGFRLHVLDRQGNSRRAVVLPEGEKAKAAIEHGGKLWIGSKTGVFRHDDGGWTRVLGDAAKAEIIGLFALGNALAASVKKLAPDNRPALAVTSDGGASWQVERIADYGDIVQAANPEMMVTRWRGAFTRGKPAEYKKHPVSAGFLDGRRWAVLDGEKLETKVPPRFRLAVHHPLMAEAEHLFPTAEGAIFAGTQGAYAIRAASGEIRDLMPANASNKPLGKSKRLWLLDDGAVLITTTFGSFRSTDGAKSWAEVDSEWSVLDAEAMTKAEDGRWWLACQRGVFFSDDNGLSWNFQKVTSTAHHYCEFRDVAVVGDKLVLAGKAGLFVGRLGREGNMRIKPVAALGDQAVDAVAWDATTGRLVAATVAGCVLAVDADAGTAIELAASPVGEPRLAVAGDGLMLAGKGGVFRLNGKVEAAGMPALDAGAALKATAGHLLAWDRKGKAYTRAPGAAWRAVEGWPMGMRDAVLDPARGTVYATDRTWIHAIPA